MTAQNAELKRSTHASSVGQILPQVYDDGAGVWVPTPGSATGNPEVVVTGSNALHDAPDSGGPVKTGGRARTSTIAAVANDDRVDQIMTPVGGAHVNLQTSTGFEMESVTGRLVVVQRTAAGNPVAGATGAAVPAGAVAIGLSDGTNLVQARSVGGAVDGSSSSAIPLAAIGNYDYNNATWDRRRNNVAGTALASAARTADGFSTTLTLYNGVGLTGNLYVAAKDAATTLTVHLQMWDSTASQFVTLASTAAFAAVALSSYRFAFAPGVLDGDYTAAVEGKSVRVPRDYRIWVQPSDANSVTYSLFRAEHVA